VGSGTGRGTGQGPGSSAPGVGNPGASQSSRDRGNTGAQTRGVSAMGPAMTAGTQAMAQDRAARQAEMGLEDRDIAAAREAERHP